MTVIKKKQTRKEVLKKQDAFLNAANDTAQWVQDHKQLVVISASLIAASILILWGSITFLKAARYDSSQIYNEALKLTNASITMDGNSDLQPPSFLPSFTSLEEKNKAVEAKWQEIIDQYKSYSIAQIARYQLAMFYMENNQLEKASASFQDYLTNATPDDNMIFLIHEQLGYLYEQQKELDKALEQFSAILEAQSNQYHDASFFHQARIYAQKGDLQKANELFDRVKKEYPESEFKRFAEIQQAALN